MDALSIAAASGLRSRMETLDMLANNLANSTTGGFKLDREFYSLYVSAEAQASSSDPTTVPVIEKQWTDFSQGLLVNTGNKLDMALSGKGFFTATAPSGPLYTRNGSFRLSPAGDDARRVTVRLGRGSTHLIEIRDGLAEGDRVILSDMSAWDAVDRVRLN